MSFAIFRRFWLSGSWRTTDNHRREQHSVSLSRVHVAVLCPELFRSLPDATESSSNTEETPGQPSPSYTKLIHQLALWPGPDCEWYDPFLVKLPRPARFVTLLFMYPDFSGFQWLSYITDVVIVVQISRKSQYWNLNFRIFWPQSRSIYEIWIEIKTFVRLSRYLFLRTFEIICLVST